MVLRAYNLMCGGQQNMLVVEKNQGKIEGVPDYTPKRASFVAASSLE